MWICESILTFVLSGYLIAGIEASQPNIVFIMADDLGKQLAKIRLKIHFKNLSKILQAMMTLVIIMKK